MLGQLMIAGALGLGLTATACSGGGGAAAAPPADSGSACSKALAAWNEAVAENDRAVGVVNDAGGLLSAPKDVVDRYSSAVDALNVASNAMEEACGSSSVAPTEALAADVPVPSEAPALFDCVISTPEQFMADTTPLVIAYEVPSEDRCRKDLADQIEGATGWEKAHPPTLLADRPKEKPTCTFVAKGTTYTVWGTTAAEYVCSAS
jgi:hypothetical protein